MTTVIPMGLAEIWGYPVDFFDMMGEEVEEVDKPTDTQVAFSYVCKRCDVYGYIPVGEPRVCWNCEQSDNLVKR